MKKYMKPAMEVAFVESQAILAGSQTVVIDQTESVEAANIEARRKNFNVWGDEEEEEDF